MPDRRTGLPAPPPAPFHSPRARSGRQVLPFWTRPKGTGPRMACFVAPLQRKRFVIGLLGGLAATPLVALVLILTAKGGASISQRLEFLTNWWVWPVYAALAALCGVAASSTRVERTSAGVDWLKHNDWSSKRRSDTVDTYRLDTVAIDHSGRFPELFLRDRATRELTLRLDELQAVPKLWDLVYNGILHSVRDGAMTNEAAEVELQLRQRIPMQYRVKASPSAG